MELFNEDTILPRTVDDILSDASGINSGGPTSGGRQVGGIIEGATYYTNIAGARIEIFPETDSTIGFASYNVAGSPVFKTIIDGTDVGDVIIGNYAGGQGILWDQSAGVFDIKATLTVGTNVNIGTAVTSSGVTTIIGNTVTTGYVNALSVTAGSVAAENITGTTITGKTIQTASSGLRTVLNAASDSIDFMYGSTTYSRIYPYVFAQGDGIMIESGGTKGSGEAFICVQEGTGGGEAGIVADEIYLSGQTSIDDYMIFGTTYTSSLPNVVSAIFFWQNTGTGNTYFVGEPSSGWYGSFDLTSIT